MNDEDWVLCDYVGEAQEPARLAPITPPATVPTAIAKAAQDARYRCA